MYQPYWDAYGQIAAETLLFTTKISTIALAATQRSMNLTLQANQVTEEAGESGAEARPSSFFFPGMPQGASGVQDQMMRNAAEWQKQMAGYFQQYLRQTGTNAGATR
jgi:hypothetical protein